MTSFNATFPHYVIISTNNSTGKHQLEEINGVIMWHHPDRVAQAFTELLLKQTDPTIFSKVFQQVEIS